MIKLNYTELRTSGLSKEDQVEILRAYAEYINSNHTRNRSVKLPPSGQDSMSTVPNKALTDLTTPPNSLQVRATSMNRKGKVK